MTSVIEGLRAEVAALRTEVSRQPLRNAPEQSSNKSQAEGPKLSASPSASPRVTKCLACRESGEVWCSHCYKCGSDSHYARGCRRSNQTHRIC